MSGDMGNVAGGDNLVAGLLMKLTDDVLYYDQNFGRKVKLERRVEVVKG